MQKDHVGTWETSSAAIVVELSQENALTLFTAWGAVYSVWVSARLDCRAGQLRQALVADTEQGNKVFVPFFQGLLAEIEAQGDAEGALIRTDKALALAAETGERWIDAFCTASAARFCSSAIRQIRRCIPHRNRSNRMRAVLSSARPFRWRNSIRARTAPPTPVRCSRPRSRAFQ